MQKITYEFNDGSTQTITVTDEFYEQYQQLVRQEKRNTKRETRRHISLDYLNELNITIADENILTTLEQTSLKDTQQIIDQAIKKLLPKQQKIVIEVFYHGKSYATVAKEMGVVKSAISNSMLRILAKLKKVLPKP